ncbi:MAG: DUF6988 family protein [Acidobacteriota bacterium]
MIEAFDSAARLNVQLSQVLSGEYPDDRRVTITLAYCNLALDHHTAIVLLFRNRLYGSGLALVRPVFEAMLRAHWVVGCAKDAEVDQVAEDPDFDIMSRVDPDRVDTAFQADGFFRQAKTDAWKAMNAYTHSGLPQLARQFSGSKVSASYSDQDVMEGLRAATASVLLLGYLLAKSTGRNDAVAQVEQLLDQAP